MEVEGHYDPKNPIFTTDIVIEESNYLSTVTI